MNRPMLSPPWFQYFRELSALFEKDKEIQCYYEPKDTSRCHHPGNEEKYKDDRIEIHVSNYEKMQALKKLLPAEKKFGNVALKINISYIEHEKPFEETIKTLFKDNPAFKYVYTFNTETNPITYVVFEKEVVQYWNDDMSDPHGMTSTLYENIARDVFNNENGLVYSTDSEKDNKWMKQYANTHATPEEVETWEYFNGKGSYSDGYIKKKKDNTVTVNDVEAFKKMFVYDEEEPF